MIGEPPAGNRRGGRRVAAPAAPGRRAWERGGPTPSGTSGLRPTAHGETGLGLVNPSLRIIMKATRSFSCPSVRTEVADLAAGRGKGPLAD